MDYLSQRGDEFAFRLGYDDFNESLTHPGIVRRTLLALGATEEALMKGDPHSAFDGLYLLGLPSSDAKSGGAEAAVVSFDVERAAVFWREHVFVKTFYERRR